MFTHVLLPTDGSAQSTAAVECGLRLAKALNARATVFNAQPEFHVFTVRAELLEDSREECVKHATAKADTCLGDARAVAKRLGFACDVEFVLSDQVYSAIIAAAQKHGCDLIVMASHGRRGMQALLLGSETHKVLTHGDIPVLVYPAAKQRVSFGPAAEAINP
ncbi:universal stress protein [Tahibacter harae]|uniref:Universal stress protein n=1 Tax=Tahibacter harae TaxID=2963937 RepID=A0ABT1QLU3_9GAMM|nr:universal stress protein [Tahibacter harae]MCQ4163499.1 universal stress protein [Tahibacter harae]